MRSEIPWQAPSSLVQAWSGKMLAQGSLADVVAFYRALPWQERTRVDCLKCTEPVRIAGSTLTELNRHAVDELGHFLADDR